jgi:transcriptional regulator, propionate catabolism operon regulatory protein
MVREGRFRADLFDRLNILELETIPLRFQREKIRDLFVHQMNEESATLGRNTSFVIEDEALAAVQRLEWKGNYRELRNFAARLAVEASDAPSITIDTIQNLVPIEPEGNAFSDCGETGASPIGQSIQSSRQNLVTVTLDADTDDLDSVYVKAAATFIEYALKRSRGNLRRAARSMGTTHSTLSRILKKNNERNVMANTREERPAFSAAARTS